MRGQEGSEQPQEAWVSRDMQVNSGQAGGQERKKLLWEVWRSLQAMLVSREQVGGQKGREMPQEV